VKKFLVLVFPPIAFYGVRPFRLEQEAKKRSVICIYKIPFHVGACVWLIWKFNDNAPCTCGNQAAD